MGDYDVQMMMRSFRDEEEEGEEDRVVEWEDGLPNTDDLTPLSQYMISSELASAFRITPEPYRSMIEVNRASQTTLTSIRKHHNNSDKTCSSLVHFTEEEQSSPADPVVEDEMEEDLMKDGSESRKTRRIEISPEEAKRPRLVWTPQLHKRFVDVVGHLGIKSAVPKTIMQLMNVEGLTRENVASHLQKYRLYLKRMQGLSIEEGPSSSDPLFATTPVPQSHLHHHHHHHESSSSNGQQQGNVPIRSMPMPMPSYGGGGGGGSMMMVQGQGHMGGNQGPSSYHGFQSHQYNMLREQQREWSGHMFNSMSSSYPSK